MSKANETNIKQDVTNYMIDLMNSDDKSPEMVASIARLYKELMNS